MQLSNNPPCPCRCSLQSDSQSSTIDYQSCCGRYIEQGFYPEKAEQLMRSRYTAFTQGNAQYIGDTMAGAALENYNPAQTKEWALSVQWKGLDVLSAPFIENALSATVRFVAHYISENTPYTIEEQSEFKKIQGRWYYTNALKLGRNDPCVCGSGKKFKKCCGFK